MSSTRAGTETPPPRSKRQTVRQGGAPSPFDRNFGTKISAKAMQWVTRKLGETFRQGEFCRPARATLTSPDALPRRRRDDTNC